MSGRIATIKDRVQASGLRFVLCMVALCFSFSAASAELDQQISRLNAEVAALEESLIGLEKNILHPASTRVTVFVSLARKDALKPDSVELYLDGAPVASHLYNDREVSSLEQGSIQELYVGNLEDGKHELRVVLTAQSSRNHYVRREVTHEFRKSPGDYRLQMVMDAQAPEFEPRVTFREWK